VRVRLDDVLRVRRVLRVGEAGELDVDLPVRVGGVVAPGEETEDRVRVECADR